MHTGTDGIGLVDGDSLARPKQARQVIAVAADPMASAIPLLHDRERLGGAATAYLCRGFGLKDKPETIERQAEVRSWLDSVDEPSPSGKSWRKAMKVVVPLWYFFAIGPACILANKAFSFCGFPAIWSWQIAWWILGIVMMWALCFKAEMATTNVTQIERAETETMIVVKET